MGWEARDVGFVIHLRLDSHGGDREREDEELADEVDAKIREAIVAVIKDPRYERIMLFGPEYYDPTAWEDDA